jgi:hypothetical protein
MKLIMIVHHLPKKLCDSSLDLILFFIEVVLLAHVV